LSSDTTALVVAAAAGAFAFHLWSEIKMIKTATGISTNIVSLDSILDLGENDKGDKPEGHSFGFNPRSRSIRRKHGTKLFRS
jgi:hypothetical protein